MTYDLYRYIFIGGLVLTIVMFITTVLIFFLLNIKNAIGDITGRNKKKGIQSISSKNAKSSSLSVNKKKSAPASNFSYDVATTSKISPQDRYDRMEVAETGILTAEPAKENKPEVVRGSYSLEQIEINDPDFRVEVEITYVHSKEVVR